MLKKTLSKEFDFNTVWKKLFLNSLIYFLIGYVVKVW